MDYSNYKKIRTITKKFSLDTRFTNIFPDIAAQPVSDFLSKSLMMAEMMPLTNEKTKSERLVSPILLDVVSHFQTKITLFSGEDLVVNPEDDLSGECDFFFSLHPPKPYIDCPIISLVEAKDEDLEWGLAQCAAQVYGAHLYNKAEGKDIPILYGCATTGTDWQFFRFENNVFYVHSKIISYLPEALGTWHWILQFYVNNFSEKEL
jgi:hypothetical protein